MTGQGLSNVFYYNKYLIDTIIRNIFIKYFFNFYDEYSYRIKYKIKKTNQLLKQSNLEEKSLEYLKFTNYYLDFNYFLYKLEEKVFYGFNIKISDIRKIIAKGVNISLNDYFIKQFYKKILKMRYTIKFNYYKFNDNMIIDNISCIEDLISFYSQDYSSYLDELYQYHLSTSPKKEADKQRFKSLTSLLETYNNDFELLYESEYKLINEISGTNQKFQNIADECFKYISYERKFENLHLENMKILNKYSFRKFKTSKEIFI